MPSRSELTTAALPGPAADDHVRGQGRELIVYLDQPAPIAPARGHASRGWKGA